MVIAWCLVFVGAHSIARLCTLEPTAIAVRPDPSITADGPFCSTDDPDAAKAFALYAGSSVEELDGTEFIVDQSGSLRSSWHPGLVPDWTDPKVFAAVVDNIAEPLPRSARLLGTLTCIDASMH
jgi:hypothetical protein